MPPALRASHDGLGKDAPVGLDLKTLLIRPFDRTLKTRETSLPHRDDSSPPLILSNRLQPSASIHPPTHFLQRPFGDSSCVFRCCSAPAGPQVPQQRPRPPTIFPTIPSVRFVARSEGLVIPCGLSRRRPESRSTPPGKPDPLTLSSDSNDRTLSL